MKVKKGIIFLLMLFLLTVSCASAPTIEFTVLEPSEIDMSSYKNVAVVSTTPYRGWYASQGYVPFRNYRTHRYTTYNFGWHLNPYISYNVPLPTELANYSNSILVSALYNTNYFTNIVSGNTADRIYASVGVPGVSRETILRYNKVDAFITSEISDMYSIEYIDVKPVYRYIYYPATDYSYQTRTYKYDDYDGFENDYYTTVSSYDYDDDDLFFFDDYDDEYYSVSSSKKSTSSKSSVQYRRRRVIDHFDYTLYQTVRIALTYNVVDAHTGYTIATRTVKDEYTKSTIITPYTRYSPSFSPYYKRLLDKMNESVLRSLAPHKVYKSESLMENDPELSSVNYAYDLVENGNLRLAQSEFLSAWDAYKHIPSGYNAAIIYFAEGDYERSIDLLQSVYNLSKNMEVANKLTEVESYKRQSERAQRQM